MDWLYQNWPSLLLALGVVGLVAWRSRAGCATGHGRAAAPISDEASDRDAQRADRSHGAQHGKSSRRGGHGGHGGHGCC